VWIKYENDVAIRVEVPNSNLIVDDIMKAASEICGFRRGSVYIYFRGEQLNSGQKLKPFLAEVTCDNPFSLKLIKQLQPTKGMLS